MSRQLGSTFCSRPCASGITVARPLVANSRRYRLFVVAAGDSPPLPSLVGKPLLKKPPPAPTPPPLKPLSVIPPLKPLHEAEATAESANGSNGAGYSASGNGADVVDQSTVEAASYNGDAASSSANGSASSDEATPASAAPPMLKPQSSLASGPPTLQPPGRPSSPQRPAATPQPIRPASPSAAGSQPGQPPLASPPAAPVRPGSAGLARPAAPQRPASPAGNGLAAEGGYMNRPAAGGNGGGGYMVRPAGSGYMNAPREGGYINAPRDGGYMNGPREGGYMQPQRANLPSTPPPEGGYFNPAKGGYMNAPRPGASAGAQGGYTNSPPAASPPAAAVPPPPAVSRPPPPPTAAPAPPQLRVTPVAPPAAAASNPQARPAAPAVPATPSASPASTATASGATTSSAAAGAPVAPRATAAAAAQPSVPLRPTPDASPPQQPPAPARPLPPGPNFNSLPPLKSTQAATGTMQAPARPPPPPAAPMRPTNNATTINRPTGLQPPAQPARSGSPVGPSRPGSTLPPPPPMRPAGQLPAASLPSPAPPTLQPLQPGAARAPSPAGSPPPPPPMSTPLRPLGSLGAPPAMRPLERAAAPPAAGTRPAQSIDLRKPATAPPPPPGMSADGSRQLRPDGLTRPAPLSSFSDLKSRGGSRDELQLKKPEPPPLSVLEPLFKDGEQEGKRARSFSPVVVVEDDEEVAYVEDEDEGKDAKKKVKAPRKKREKVTAEMKRKAREERATAREEKAAKERKEREEIFEVGDEGMSLEELADLMQVDGSAIVRALFMKGIMLSMNQVLDKNTVKLVASEFDVLVVDKEESTGAGSQQKTDFMDESDIDDLVPRPPVITVMGHVDHGKTSLLDYIRKARVASGEAGGITQAIGAYNTDVEVDGETKTLCFLDTPGHEAFSAMRARGASVTDVAVIIVAADDGVRPQTREAISHAQAANVPIIVAINKVDKPGADVEKTKQGLLELNLVPEEWGGSTPMVPISAKKGTGVSDLLQMLLWMAEEQSLVANPNRMAAGTVIEAHLDKKRGAVATLLVQAGTLRAGDIVAAGAAYGKVRTLNNDLELPVESAGPSIAVQMVGLNAVPAAGDEFQVYKAESEARESASKFVDALRNQRMLEMTGGGNMITLSSLATIDEDTEALQRLNIIIKGDTSGMVEAIKSALNGLPQDSVVLRYLLSAAGDITVSDVDLAAASNGLILGFNVQPDEAVASHAKRTKVTINTYNVIYNLIDDVKAAMEGKLRLVEERVLLGKAEVKALFGAGAKRVAGCAVLEGKLGKGSRAIITRNGKQIAEGPLNSLRRVKDNVEEVVAGFECGVGVEGFTDWAVGDTIESYRIVQKSRRLEDAKAQTIDLTPASAAL